MLQEWEVASALVRLVLIPMNIPHFSLDPSSARFCPRAATQN